MSAPSASGLLVTLTILSYQRKIRPLYLYRYLFFILYPNHKDVHAAGDTQLLLI